MNMYFTVQYCFKATHRIYVGSGFKLLFDPLLHPLGLRRPVKKYRQMQVMPTSGGEQRSQELHHAAPLTSTNPI